MTIQCQFVLIEQVNRGRGSFRDEFGARVGCPICGQIRTIWSDGEIIKEVLGDQKLHEQTGNTKD